MRVSSSEYVSAPYCSGSRRPRRSRFTPFSTATRTGAPYCDGGSSALPGDERVKGGAHLGLGKLGADDRLSGRLEQDEPDAAVGDLLVAPERGPGALAVGRNR